jgi:hypothetical protein
MLILILDLLLFEQPPLHLRPELHSHGFLKLGPLLLQVEDLVLELLNEFDLRLAVALDGLGLGGLRVEVYEARLDRVLLLLEPTRRLLPVMRLLLRCLCLFL